MAGLKGRCAGLARWGTDDAKLGTVGDVVRALRTHGGRASGVRACVGSFDSPRYCSSWIDAELLRCSLICRITFDPMTIGNLSYTCVYLGSVQKLADHNRRPVETFILPVTDRKFFFLPRRICIILRVAKTRRYTLT